ncbi:GNAT family N-acetyltransferase [Roseomonas sp. NAR14]|uniref:GNAT family N-acetyltransferase n=1 Tax=Roseomonas acroporae TaxID=2937791 RepID=A0A9X2BT33_9PROT|nr:GNAT family N-acetyltransferase [Roseomonas acroporae]MCK8782876.1 GNAT family N-acetyltransferase [Roseomonas acroporae]
MTTDRAAAPAAGWRPMREADLGAVVAIAGAVHPGYPERPAILAERLHRHAPGCLLLETAAGPGGYVLSHPWRLWDIPKLDTPLGPLPEAPDAYYIHDLALLPGARGGGRGAAAVVLLLAEAARLGLGTAALVAVGGSVPFWAARGFAEATRPALRASLASYDAAARYMLAPVPVRAAVP